MKSYEDINERIASGKAMVLTAEEVIDYAEKHGEEKTAEEVDVVTTATFGPMCSSGAFLNFGHSEPKIRMTEAWIDDVPAYSGIAAVDLYIGATQLRHYDSANIYYPGDFLFGGGHVIEKLVAGEECSLFALSYGTDDYPRREIRTNFTIRDLNQAIMVNPRNCYQNYNVATNISNRTIYTYLGKLKPKMENLTYSSAGQLSPLLNDPFYRTIGIGTSVWLAGARGIVYGEGTQHTSAVQRSENGVPSEGAGTLALSGDMKEMNPDYVKGLSLKGYGASLALGVGIPIPILDAEMLRHTLVRDEEIFAEVIDYSEDYPQKTGRVIAKVNYGELRTGKVEIDGKEVSVSSMSSYSKAQSIAEILKEEIRSGDFQISKPSRSLPQNKTMGSLTIHEDEGREKR